MAALKGLVEFQRQSAQALFSLLEEELIAITNRVSTHIEQLAQQKVTLINNLQSTDERIARHPEVNTLNTDPELKALIQEIQSIIHNCQRLNQVNGEALQRAQLSFNKLNNLMQQSHGKIGMTYTSDGQTHTVSTLGTNIKA